MTTPFDKTLQDCIQEIELAGADIDSVVAKYPGQADELRRHLEVWAALSASAPAETPQSVHDLGLARLSAAINTTERGGDRLMNDLSRSGGFALKLTGAFAMVAGIILGITYLTGDWDVEFGSNAQADHTNACLDSVLGNLADPQDSHFTFDDLIAFKGAFLDQNTDPRYDTDEDGDVDIDDVMVYIQALKSCFTGGPPGGPP